MPKIHKKDAPPPFVRRSDAEKLSAPMQFEPHSGFGGTDPDGNPWPLGYISTTPVPQPVFELNCFLGFDREALLQFGRRLAAANDLLAALKLMAAELRNSAPVKSGAFLAADLLRTADAAIAKAECDQVGRIQ